MTAVGERRYPKIDSRNQITMINKSLNKTSVNLFRIQLGAVYIYLSTQGEKFFWDLSCR